MSLKLVSLNIEKWKHLDGVESFLRDAPADVVCLQEVLEVDIPRLEKSAGRLVAFAPSGIHPAEGRGEGPLVTGHAIFSLNSVSNVVVPYYFGSEARAREGAPQNLGQNFGVIAADVDLSGSVYRIIGLHYDWTPDGQPSERQRELLKTLFPILDSFGEFVLCGDFNAPRGGEIFGAFASRYTDNVPKKYVWSIDLARHRAGPSGKIQSDAHVIGLEGLMVDGLFSTPSYEVSDVRLQDGLSDHLAIVADITKR